MLAYKGVNRSLQATMGSGVYQFEINKTVYVDSSKTTKSGFHCAEDPLDCFFYYRPDGNNRFFLVDAAGSIDEDAVDSRIACTELTLIKELSLKEMTAHALKYIILHPYRDNERRRSVIVDETVQGTGKYHICIARGPQPKAKGKNGSIIGFLQETEPGCFVGARVIIVGEEGVKENTWYTLKENRILEVEHEEENH